VDAQSALQAEFPDKPIYFTEGSTFGTRGAVQITEILQHWARSYNAWVVMLDEDRKPNNGPHTASRTCIELMRDKSVSYHFDYFMYGQFMKFVPRGAVRLATEPGDKRFAHIAFKNPDGSFTLVVVNAVRSDETFQVSLGDRTFTATLPGKSVGTYTWSSF
jgi:glucosylceramidase